MRMMPIQKTGSETKNGGRLRNARRSAPPAPYVAVNAIVTARKIATTSPSTASTSVCGKAVATRSDTAAPLATEYPKSPVRKPAIDFTYWTIRGWSAP